MAPSARPGPAAPAPNSRIGEVTGDSIRSVAVIRRQRNELFEALSERGVETSDFHLEVGEMAAEWGHEDVVEIRHLPTGSYFLLYIQSPPGEPERYRVEWFVHDGPHKAEGTVTKWRGMLQALGKWGTEVQYVTESPDLWAELQQVPEMLAASQLADASNAPFTPDEQAEISSRLDEIKNLVREQFELADKQLAAIDQRLDDAKEACGRLGRKDWIMLFYGAVISTAMTDSVPPGVVQTVLATVVHGIAHIFGFGGSPPVIGTWP